MSSGVAVGIRTLSMTWMIPLLFGTSVAVTFAPLTVTPSPTANDSGLPLTVVAERQSVTAEAGTSLSRTW